jgi:hypothetical protein
MNTKKDFFGEDEWIDMKTYVVTYENGATNLIQAESLIQAIENSDKAILNCLPDGFNKENIVRSISAREIYDDDEKIGSVSFKKYMELVETIDQLS